MLPAQGRGMDLDTVPAVVSLLLSFSPPLAHPRPNLATESTIVQSQRLVQAQRIPTHRL